MLYKGVYGAYVSIITKEPCINNFISANPPFLRDIRFNISSFTPYLKIESEYDQEIPQSQTAD